MRLESERDLAAAVEWLIAVEPRFVPVVLGYGLPPLRRSEAGLKSLLRIVTDQLISLKAAESIWGRLENHLGAFEPRDVLGCPEGELRALGLSAAKARAFHAAAAAFQSGSLQPVPSGSGSDDELLSSLTEIPGIGPWTAHIYLLITSKSADAWPAADLALQRAAMDLFSLPGRPSARQMVVLAEPWRPYRSAATLLLWSHYRGLKQMPQTRTGGFTGLPH